MKITYICQYFSTPQKGVAGSRAYEFAKRLVARGHKVTIVSGIYSLKKRAEVNEEFIRHEEQDGMKLIWINLVYSTHQGFFYRVWNFILFSAVSSWIALRLPCDLVFATSPPLTVGIPGLLAKWFRRKPFVFEVRDLWPDFPIAMGILKNHVAIWMIKRVEKKIYKSSSRIIVLAPGIRDSIAQTGYPKEQLILIPNACDLELFMPSEIKPIRKKLRVGNDELVLIYMGAHGRANGLDAIIDVAAEIQERQENGIQFVLIGDGSEKQRLMDRAQRLNLTNIQFLPPMPKQELATIVNEADVGMQILKNVPTFYWATSPNKFFDYISAGLPVLINYPGWLAEIIKQNQCGVEIVSENPQAFADAVILMKKQRHSLKEMGKRSRLLAEKKFDRNKLAMKFIETIENIRG
ncbi:glycosyltransferase family 4 protein [bacterium]|nr:glycosyltransferase family 4 protein [bacterium]